MLDIKKYLKNMTKIIAELCQNHNGDIKILEEMVHAASDAGAEYVLKSNQCIHLNSHTVKDLMTV